MTVNVGQRYYPQLDPQIHPQLREEVRYVRDALYFLRDRVQASTPFSVPTGTGYVHTTGGVLDAASKTPTQVTADLNLFTAALKGLVDAPGVATGKFLRDDNTWQVIAAGGTVTSVGQSTGIVCTPNPIVGAGTVGLANRNANSIMGNNTGGATTPLDLTGTQVTAMLDVFTSVLNGLAPFSGGGTTNFLRADGNWAAPSTATDAIKFSVHQVGHGFTLVGQVIYFDGANYQLAESNATGTLGLFMVSTVVGADDFIATQAGVVTGLTIPALTAGNYYFVSNSSAGAITSVEPSPYSNPIFFALSATSGVVIPFRPSTLVTTPGADTEVIFNDSGNLGADADNTWIKAAGGNLGHLIIGNNGVGATPLFPTLTRLLLVGPGTDTVFELSGTTAAANSGIADYTFLNRGVASGTTRIATILAATGASKDVGTFRFLIKKTAAAANPTSILQLSESGYLGMGGNALSGAPPLVMIHTSETKVLAASPADDYSSGIRLAPTYDQAFTVTRHNYLDLNNPVLTNSAAVTDAAVMRFDANAGTHKAVDSGTTKTTPGTVNAWVKVNINGTIFFIPCYTSKTT